MYSWFLHRKGTKSTNGSVSVQMQLKRITKHAWRYHGIQHPQRDTYCLIGRLGMSAVMLGRSTICVLTFLLHIKEDANTPLQTNTLQKDTQIQLA